LPEVSVPSTTGGFTGTIGQARVLVVASLTTGFLFTAFGAA
jgi:hypothetical protein